MVWRCQRKGLQAVLAAGCFLTVGALAKDHDAVKTDDPLPWLTGPLLTPSASVIPNGHYNIEPYEYVTTNTGAYNSHWKTHTAAHNVYNVITQVPIQIGMPARMDFVFVPQWSWNHVQGASHWELNDMNFGFDYQLYHRRPHDWIPTLKLALRANFPFGKYQHLDRHAKGTDLGGSGSWVPAVGLGMSNLIHISGPVFLAWRSYVQYGFPTPVRVKGLNAYGGGQGTSGTAFPGQSLLALWGFELSLPAHFALAGDVQYLHTNKTRFKGRKGSTDGVPNRVAGPSSEGFSVAPALEYNWSAYYGVIAGAWFSVGGRNTAEFVSGVVAINIYH